VGAPRATYRLQFSGQFRLAEALDLAPYLQRIGISHVYSSPLLAARRGSTHGYDVVDPGSINPEIGTEHDLRRVAARLHRYDMGLVLDIVPNHMAVGQENPAWDDVLAHGQSSAFARWFDIDWDAPRRSARGRVVLPILGDELPRVLARNEIRLTYAHGAFRFHYFDHSFPVDPGTLPSVLGDVAAVPGRRARRPQRPPEALRGILDRLCALPPRTAANPRARRRRRDDGTTILKRIQQRYRRSSTFRAVLDARIAALNAPRGRRRLSAVLEAQAYRLVHWRRAGREVNYRRFFNINELAGVRVEDPAVFAATHAHLLGWVADGLVDGLRIDHIDGLLDPLGYLRRLRSAIARIRGDAEFPIYVEKILCAGEALPDAWPVHGTTGYEFIGSVEPLFLEPHGVQTLERWYCGTVARGTVPADFSTFVVRAKRRMLQTELACDVDRLNVLARRLPRASGLRAGELRRAIIELIARLPVYRTYLDRRTGALDAAGRRFTVAAATAAGRAGRVPQTALGRVGQALLRPARRSRGRGGQDPRLAFVERVQQTSGPAMAKGLEDTALYAWVPLVSRNEVGNAPEGPIGDSVGAAHAANRTRASRWPRSMLCTTTHDTKRSGDVRARLDVLSEIPATWMERIDRWRALNDRHRPRVRGRRLPDDNTEYLFYQALIGVWPLRQRDRPAGAMPSRRTLGVLRQRVAAYMSKAAREAKVHTSWTDPDAAFETALDRFITAALTPARSRMFLADVADFVASIARPGLWNALGRVLVHLTAPGVPDIYQGDELWNFTLVDPDNRRPVRFDERRAVLTALTAKRNGARLSTMVRDLVGWPEDGGIKLHVTRSVLDTRRVSPDLFSAGGYEALAARGSHAHHVFAFARTLGQRLAVTVIPRLVASLVGLDDNAPVGVSTWRSTALVLPVQCAGVRFTNTVTNETCVATRHEASAILRMSDVFGISPVALLVSG
jgi:(1->4)-alpha-D-glucan 1-alpha-D-glucosylmutase